MFRAMRLRTLVRLTVSRILFLWRAVRWDNRRMFMPSLYAGLRLILRLLSWLTQEAFSFSVPAL